MRTRNSVLFLGLLFSVPAWAQVEAPVKKVVLYKNGMGYFQHLGTVQGDSPLEIELPSSQLNDVLKSLTLLDLDGGRVTAVSYDSAAPLERRLEELPIRPSQTLAAFLNQIRGVPVQAGSVQGRLLNAEIKTRTEPDNVAVQVVQAAILTADGQVKLVEMERLGGFQIQDPALAADLQRFLQLLSSAQQRDVRRLKIQTRGSGQRRLFISYTSEAPIWKTTYRVVLDPARKALLQGWAIVDNTSSVDWNNVELSLVSGAPVSFIQALSEPIYGSRPVIPVYAGANVAPEVYEGAIRDERAAAPEEKSAGPSSGRELAKRARAAMDSFAELTPGVAAAPAPPPPPELGEAVRQAAFQTAQGRSLAEQFEYRLPQPVTISRNQSALLSILQSEVEAAKVSVHRLPAASRNPRLAVWLENTGGTTLDGGAFTVIDSNAFAGEGLFETIRPAEKRLLSYAVDLAVEIDSKQGSETKRVERVAVHRGVIRLERKVVEKNVYTIRNNADADRTVVLEQPVRFGWQLTGENKPEETSANYYRFQTVVKARATGEYEVREERPDQVEYLLTNVTPDLIAIWVRDKSIDPETEKALRTVASKQAEIADLLNRLERLEQEREELFSDQRRVRDNLGRLGQTPEESRLRQRYIEQLNSQEDRLGQMRAEQQRLEDQRDAKQRELNEFIEGLDFERKV